MAEIRIMSGGRERIFSGTHARRVIVPALTLSAALIASSVNLPHAGEARRVRESCVQLKETKIIGPICKVHIENSCDHAVDLTVVHRVELRRLIIKPVATVGNALTYVDGGSAEKEGQHPLAAGESQWFVYKYPGESVEVARCKVNFKYSYTK
jgi:hypothetical protein